jgi:hypothetical protein
MTRIGGFGMVDMAPIVYSAEVRPQDTQMAMKTVQVSLFPNETKPVAIDFAGTCPRCGDAIRHREWIVVVAGAMRLNDMQREALSMHLDTIGVDRSHGDQTVDLICTCAEPHPKRPKDKQGCGSRFRLRVIWP